MTTSLSRFLVTSPARLGLAPPPVPLVGQQLEDHEDEGKETKYGEGVVAAALPRAGGVTLLRREKILDEVTPGQRRGHTEVSRDQPLLSLLNKIVTDADILHLDNNFSFHSTMLS